MGYGCPNIHRLLESLFMPVLSVSFSRRMNKILTVQSLFLLLCSFPVVFSLILTLWGLGTLPGKQSCAKLFTPFIVYYVTLSLVVNFLLE